MNIRDHQQESLGFLSLKEKEFTGPNWNWSHNQFIITFNIMLQHTLIILSTGKETVQSSLPTTVSLFIILCIFHTLSTLNQSKHAPSCVSQNSKLKEHLPLLGRICNNSLLLHSANFLKILLRHFSYSPPVRLTEPFLLLLTDIWNYIIIFLAGWPRLLQWLFTLDELSHWQRQSSTSAKFRKFSHSEVHFVHKTKLEQCFIFSGPPII